jgi:hypothetical protein
MRLQVNAQDIDFPGIHPYYSSRSVSLADKLLAIPNAANAPLMYYR